MTMVIYFTMFNMKSWQISKKTPLVLYEQNLVMLQGINLAKKYHFSFFNVLINLDLLYPSLGLPVYISILNFFIILKYFK